MSVLFSVSRARKSAPMFDELMALVLRLQETLGAKFALYIGTLLGHGASFFNALVSVVWLSNGLGGAQGMCGEMCCSGEFCGKCLTTAWDLLVSVYEENVWMRIGDVPRVGVRGGLGGNVLGGVGHVYAVLS